MKKLSIAVLFIFLVVLGCEENPVFPGNSPDVPRNPSPVSGATDQNLTLTISWECSSPDGRPLTYDVYIGRESQPALEATNVTQPSYIIENLVPNRRYFWRIAARDDRGLVQDGPIWYFDTVSSAWEQYASPTTRNLNGMSISGNTGWAVGDVGTLLKFDNGQWSEVSTGLLNNLNDVAWDGTTGYCVGDTGVILKLTTAGWSTETTPTTDILYAVALDGSGGAWAVGGTNTVLRLTSGVWSVISVPEVAGYTLYDVAADETGTVIIAASGSKAFYWDGSIWSEETAASGGSSLYVDLLSAGYSQFGSGAGFWVGNAESYMIYRSVAADSTVTWVNYGVPASATPNGMDFEGGGFGMIAFDTGKISRFDGSGWSTGGAVASEDLNDVAYLSAGEAWAVGDGGVIYHYSPVE